MTDAENPEPLRRESETEVLDDSQAARGPLTGLSELPGLAGLSRLKDPARLRRFRRALSVASVLAVAALSATFSGVLTHGSGVRRNAAPDPDAVVVHLVGGGATLEGDQKTYVENGAAGLLRFSVRNDGPQPIDIVAATVTDPGVSVSQINRNIPAAPGDQIMIPIAVTVNCAFAGVAERPAALHLSVRTANGHLHPVTVTVPQPQVTLDDNQLANVLGVNGALENYHVLCGAVANHVTPTVTYGGMTTTATTANPTIGYRVTIINSTPPADAAGSTVKVVAPTGTTLPGVVTTTDLERPRSLAHNESVTVEIDFRITDCAALRDYMNGFAANGNGYQTAAVVAGDGVLTINQADERFPSTPQAISAVDLSKDSHSFYTDFAQQVVAACPSLR